MSNPYDYMKEYEQQEIDYTTFCKLVDVEKKVGKAKDLQLKQLGQYMDVFKQNRKIYLRKVYEEDEIKIKNPLSHTNDKRDDNFKVDISLWHGQGIYSITLNNKIYIGQTSDFRDRFNQHYRCSTENSYKTNKLLSQGGTFQIVEIENDLNKRLEKEKYWINYYSNNPNYECINIQLKKQKIKYKRISVEGDKYNKVIEFLKENNIKYK